MRVEENDPAFGTLLVVSRRNILTLLAKLDGNPPASYCTIGAPVGYGKFHIKAEEDDVHYNHPNRLEVVGDSRPGPMHPATETVLADGKVPDGFEVAFVPTDVPPLFAPGMTDLMVTPESIDDALSTHHDFLEGERLAPLDCPACGRPLHGYRGPLCRYCDPKADCE